MKCQAMICDKCRQALINDKVIRNGRLTEILFCENCDKEFPKSYNVKCNSYDFETPESYKKTHATFNMRLICCTKCGTFYNTLEKIVGVRQGVKGYIELKNKILGNIDLFENEKKDA